MKGLLTSLITVLTFTGLQAQSLPTAPKLVVGLTIDQLRTDYLEAFSSLYGERGFKRLWKEGRVFHNAEYTFSGVDRASAMAAIYSGSTPSVNGIISNRWMDVSTLRTVNSTDDPAFMGYYTDQTCAPTKLLTSTIADELKIATQGKGLVYAIAPYCDAAIFAAGHAGNGAFWINPTTGKWSGTTPASPVSHGNLFFHVACTLFCQIGGMWYSNINLMTTVTISSAASSPAHSSTMK